MKKTRSKPRARRTGTAPGRGERRSSRQGDPQRRHGTGNGHGQGNGHGSSRGPGHGNSRGRGGAETVPEVRSTRTRTGTFEDLFAGMPKNVKAIGERLREIVMEVLPGSKETIYLGWKIALYSDPSEVCGIQPVQSKYCNLYFSNGANMADPDGLLEGTGKSIRHVKIRELEDLPIDGLMNLIREAKKQAR